MNDSRHTPPDSLAAEPSAARLGKSPRRWLLATRPAFLLLAAIAAGIGLASAARTGEIEWVSAALTLMGAVLFHAAVNVDNDFHDATNGSDAANSERLYPFTGGSRMIQNGVLDPRQTRRLARWLFLSSAVIGLVLVAHTGIALLWLSLFGALLGWAYSAPPLRLNSRGLGEIVVGAGFGILMPAGADLVQSGTVHAPTVAAGFGFALMAINLLLLNQFPDASADRRAGKHHWVVRLGRRRSRGLYALIAISAFAAPALWVGIGWLPAATLLTLAALPPTLFAAGRLWRDGEDPRRLGAPIRANVFATLLYGTAIVVGLSLG